MALAMNGWFLLDGNLGCFTPCRTCRKKSMTTDDSCEQAVIDEPLAPSRPIPEGTPNMFSGTGCGADWTPRAAWAPGKKPSPSPKSDAKSLPNEFLINTPMYSQRPKEPSPTLDPAAKALEHSRLRMLVSEFIEEATHGRECSIIILKDVSTKTSAKLDAKYELRDKAERLVVHCKDKEKNTWELIGSWILNAVLGAYRAEESALVHGAKRELTNFLSDEELRRSAVLEFGRGPCAPLLLVEDSVEHRDRFVSGMQIILRLFSGAWERAAADVT